MGDQQNLDMLLQQWQQSGRHAVLERLVHAAEPVVSCVIERVLRRRGIQDPHAVDDALALVFDHLRRLPGAGDGERSVSPFAPAAHDGHRGRAFLYRLAQDRALDVARARRRRARHVCTFSQLDELAVSRLEDRCVEAPAGSAAAEAGDESSRRLHAALARLPPRDRQVIALLLEGKNQAVIAHVLGVCEGTVSRIRRRAIDRLRELLRC
jgi:RNA polymerase sigma factor (sigma-70 family)